MIGVDVLADQRDFAHAGIRQPLDLGEDFIGRPRRLHATRIRHDAEGAELVAAFLHGDEGGDTAAADRGAARRGQMIEFVVDRELGIDRLAVARGARQQIGQAVIALRTHDEVNNRCAADDFLTFGLRDAAGHRDHHAPAGGGRGVLHAADAAKLGIDLLRRLFADVAGVEDDQIGVIGACGLDIAFRRQSVRHTLRVVDVHLAAERFDVEFFRSVHAGWST